MQQTTGRAALVQNNLPAAKTITGATNATPIVVTTSAAHGLQTNEIIYISGVGGNTNANGYFVAQVVSTTTVALTAYPAGTNVAGSGAYTSGGTLQSLGYGVTVPVPNDLTDVLQAGSINVPHEAAIDRLAYLQLLASVVGNNALLNTIGAGFKGDPDDANGGTFKLYGLLALLDNGSEVGEIEFGANTNITATDPTAFFRPKCHKVMTRDRVDVPDSGSWPKTFGTSDGDVFRLNGNPGAPRVVLLDTTDSPERGERMMFMCFSVQEGGSNVDIYTFEQGASVVAIFRTSGGLDTTPRQYDATFVYDDDPGSPGNLVWLLESSSGMSVDDQVTPAQCGVIAVRA